MNKRIVLAATASGVALATVVGVALGVGHDEPRLVRTAGVSAPLEESTTSTAADGPQKVAELDATVENHEARISALESTTTVPAAPASQPVETTTTTAPAEAVAEPSSTTTTTATVPPTTQPAPTTTTTILGPPWWCWQLDADGHRSAVPCDSTTTP